MYGVTMKFSDRFVRCILLSNVEVFAL